MKIKPRKPNIDEKKHVSYSKTTEKILLKWLREKYGDDEGLRIFEEGIKNFEDMCLNDILFIGGKENPMGTMLYDNLMCVACWEAESKKSTIEELDALVLETSFGKRGRTQLPSWFNGDNKVIIAILTFVYKLWAKGIHKKFIEGKLGDYWDAEVNVDPMPEGVQFVLHRCPIYEVMKKRDHLDLMPAMWNPDYENFGVKNLVLVRPKIVANGDTVCDHRIVGKNSKLAKNSPAYINDKGLLINDLPKK